ncbi:MAG: metal-dependent hydrolase [Pseudomonadales bacterium]|nr:metal-dependent hydrolase [Pseudomonadales bacterium]
MSRTKKSAATLPWKTPIKTPKEHTIIPRPAQFAFTNSTPRFWQGEVFGSRMFDAMQLAFPDGERMFIQSVRNYADKISDPVLKTQVKHFIYQEGQHGKVHSDFNKHLKNQGLNIDGSVAMIKATLTWFQKFSSHKVQLAATVAAEHLTASLGEHLLSDNEKIFINANPTMKAFYMWHGAEEVEHKAVAWDVYQQAAGGGYFTRTIALAALYPLALVPLTAGTMAMMHSDGKLNMNELKKGVRIMFGKNGLFRKTLPAILEFYKPGFHPWQTGYPDKFEQWKSSYEASNDMDIAMKATLN